MKKRVPNLVKINTTYKPIEAEKMLIWRYNRMVEEGYTIPLHDYCVYCALIKRHMSKDILARILIDDKNVKERVRFEYLYMKIENGESISQEELVFYRKWLNKLSIEMKEILKKEIARTNLKGKLLNNLSRGNSKEYETLIELAREFRSLTLLDWFIPIVLTYKMRIHIFVKHVEETKFAEGNYKVRSFFQYHHDEIFTLLKSILRNNEDEIKEHFLENSIKRLDGNLNEMKDYIRKKKNPIKFDGDTFHLWIDKNGFIKQFFQV